MSFMNLPEEYANKSSKNFIIPVEYEGNVTFGRGCHNGAKEIVKASKHLEYYDCELENEAFLDGIHVLNVFADDELKNLKEDDAVKIIKDKIKTAIDSCKVIEPKKESKNHLNKRLIFLGGDHSVTIGIVKAFNDVYRDKFSTNSKKFSVIILDAHSDFRHSWNNSVNNHACVAKRLSSEHKLALVGIRAMDYDEHHEIKKLESEGKVSLVKAHEFDIDKVINALDKLENNVYVSIDVDVFDPSIIRNTGTPEPAGLTWHDVDKVLKKIFEKKNVIGVDVVEFSPENDNCSRTESYMVAKLVYRIISLWNYFEMDKS